MTREQRDLRPRIPIREIDAQDTLQNFSSNLLDQCGADLTTLYEENKGGRHVWVYDDGTSVLGVVLFADRVEDFHVEIITNNFAIRSEVLNARKPGTALYSEMEETAINRGVTAITLDSVPTRIGYWKRLGFEEAKRSFKGRFCMLTPMIKRL